MARLSKRRQTASKRRGSGLSKAALNEQPIQVLACTEVINSVGDTSITADLKELRHEEDMCCEHETHPWKTFNFEQVAASGRFAYLADPLMRRGYSIQKRRRDVVLSLFAWHNETINVWSHLLGGFLFVILFFSWHFQSEPTVRLGQMAHDSFDNLANKFHEVSTEAKKYSSALSQEAEIFRTQTLQLAESAALRLSSVPLELRNEMLRQQGAFEEWLKDEKVAIEAALVNLEKRGAEWVRRMAIVEWMAAHASNDTVDMDNFAQMLKEKLASFIPRDFEARRAAAAFRGWLAEERRTLETLLFRLDQHSTSTPIWPVLTFCFGGVMCLGCSAVYHWWVGYCRHYHDALCRVDLAGISFMIWGSSVPLIYYVFLEDELWRNIYLGGATLLCGATLGFTMLPAEMLHRVKLARVFSYIAAGAFVVAPLIHSIIRWGPNSDQVRRYVNDGYLALVAFLYVLGAFIYISRFPEKLYPGRFDLLFASHQIWHALVFAAAYVHYFGAVELYLWRVELEMHSTVTMNASTSLG